MLGQYQITRLPRGTALPRERASALAAALFLATTLAIVSEAPEFPNDLFDSVCGVIAMQFSAVSAAASPRHAAVLFLVAPIFAIFHVLTPTARQQYATYSIGLNAAQLLFAAYQAVRVAGLQEAAVWSHVRVTSEAEAEEAQLQGTLSLLLPPSVVPRVAGGGRFAESYGSVSILFLEVQRFDAISRELEPLALIALLNDVFSHFDALVAETPGASKHESLGSIYVVTAGVPEPCPDHASVLAGLALRCRDAAGLYAAHGRPLGLKMGLHSGEIIGGIIGQQLPRRERA